MTEDNKPELHLVEGGDYDTTAPDIDGAFLGGRVIYEDNKVVFDNGDVLPLVTDELPEGFVIEGEFEGSTSELVQGIVESDSVSDSSYSQTTSVVGPEIALTEEEMVNLLTNEISFALMKWWFPNRVPTGEDYEKWIEISLKDASAVVQHLMQIGVLKLEKIDGD